MNRSILARLRAIHFITVFMTKAAIVLSHRRTSFTPLGTLLWGFVVLTCISSVAAADPTGLNASDSARTPVTAITGPQKVDVVEIDNEVDLGMVAYVERAVEVAEQDHAVLLLHVNTFGGRVDAATKIRDAVLHARVPLTVAFIDKRAISAGSLISLAAKKIVMSSGSTIGAATPIYQTGDKASEKVVSYMRAEMRTTAEANHRDPAVAEAMVDESLGLDSTHHLTLAAGKLLTLTTDDALKVGYADAVAETEEAALKAVGVEQPQITNVEEGIGDKAVRFLTSGLVSALLIMIGIGGIFYSVKTGHFGSITIASIAALVLFFGGQYITAVAPLIALVLFLAGVTLLFIEVSPIPTFGLAGVLGIGGVFLGLFLALAGDPRTLTPERLTQTFVTLAISLVGIIVLGVLIIKYAPKATWLQKFRNTATTADTTFYADEQAALVGKIGVAQTMLRPAGIVLLDDKKIDAVTKGEFISPGTSVVVTRMTGNRPVVQALEEQVVTQVDSDGPDAGDAFGGRLPKGLSS